MPTRAEYTNQEDVLDAVIRRLVTQIDYLSDQNVYLTILPTPPYWPPDELFVTVSPGAGRFLDDLHGGGGPEQCTEDAGILVSMYCRDRPTQAGHDRDSLIGERRLLRIKRDVLRALCTHDPDWDGLLLLRQPISPTDSGAPEPLQDSGQQGRLVTWTLRFNLLWDWDLTR